MKRLDFQTEFSLSFENQFPDVPNRGGRQMSKASAGRSLMKGTSPRIKLIFGTLMAIAALGPIAEFGSKVLDRWKPEAPKSGPTYNFNHSTVIIVNFPKPDSN